MTPTVTVQVVSLEIIPQNISCNPTFHYVFGQARTGVPEQVMDVMT